ncbi:MAG: hypothetical protein DMF72_12530 [Acidobacteria bacterium]|nr:MAG: hypothetical protein DMF72_12530 [Acidobacteriota bacterium]
MSSSDEAWMGCADIFSGRPNPCWVIEERVVASLMDLWNRMEGHSEPFPNRAVLGYRGCHLKGPRNRTWFAYHGVVTFIQNELSESRHDRERLFEQTLLASAPKGILPPPLPRFL